MRCKGIWNTQWSIQHRKNISKSRNVNKIEKNKKISDAMKKLPKKTQEQKRSSRLRLIKKYNDRYAVHRAISRNGEHTMGVTEFPDKNVCLIDRYQSGKIRMKEIYRCPENTSWDAFMERIWVHVEEEYNLVMGNVGTVTGIP